MEQYIIKILKQIWRNFKKFWWIGLICVILAVAFIVVTVLKDEAEANNVENVGQVESVPQSEEGRKLVGTQSMLKYDWGFLDIENSDIYEARIAEVRENLVVINNIVYTADFRDKINESLIQKEMEILTSEDVYIIGIISYDVMQINVYGYDAERVIVIDEIVRNEVERISREIYVLDDMRCIVDPIVVEAINTDGTYSLTHNVYEKDDATVSVENETNDAIIEQTESVEKDYQLFNLKNIVILLSAFVLYFVIIVLITISNENMYDQKGNQKNL